MPKIKEQSNDDKILGVVNESLGECTGDLMAALCSPRLFFTQLQILYVSYSKYVYKWS